MKEYKKPCSLNIETERGLVPLAAIASAAASTQLAPAAALVGGYVAGRAAKQMMEISQLTKSQNHLEKVIVY